MVLIMAKLDDFSRFFQTGETIVDGNETFGIWKPPSFIRVRPLEEKIGRFRVTSQTEGRPDLIANALYGTPLLDWVLISFNKVRDPLNWPRAGTTIEYPIDSLVFPLIS
jgi:hypothetical protein